MQNIYNQNLFQTIGTEVSKNLYSNNFECLKMYTSYTSIKKYINFTQDLFFTFLKLLFVSIPKHEGRFIILLTENNQ